MTVNSFYLHAKRTIQMCIVFALGFVRDDAKVTLGDEHEHYLNGYRSMMRATDIPGRERRTHSAMRAACWQAATPDQWRTCSGFSSGA